MIDNIFLKFLSEKEERISSTKRYERNERKNVLLFLFKRLLNTSHSSTYFWKVKILNTKLNFYFLDKSLRLFCINSRHEFSYFCPFLNKYICFTL